MKRGFAVAGALAVLAISGASVGQAAERAFARQRHRGAERQGAGLP